MSCLGNCPRGDTRFRGVNGPTWTQRHHGEPRTMEIRGLDRHEETTLNKASMGAFWVVDINLASVSTLNTTWKLYSSVFVQSLSATSKDNQKKTSKKSKYETILFLRKDDLSPLPNLQPKGLVKNRTGRLCFTKPSQEVQSFDWVAG